MRRKARRSVGASCRSTPASCIRAQASASRLSLKVRYCAEKPFLRTWTDHPFPRFVIVAMLPHCVTVVSSELQKRGFLGPFQPVTLAK